MSKRQPWVALRPRAIRGYVPTVWIASNPNVLSGTHKYSFRNVLDRRFSAGGPSGYFNGSQAANTVVTGAASNPFAGCTSATIVVSATPIVLPGSGVEHRLLTHWAVGGGGFDAFLVWWNGPNFGFGLRNAVSTIEARYGAGGVSNGKLANCVSTWNNARTSGNVDRHRFWINGTQLTSTDLFSNGDINPVCSDITGNMVFGADGNTTNPAGATHLHMWAAYPGDIGDADALALSINPWDVFYDPPPARYGAFTVGGASFQPAWAIAANTVIQSGARAA